MIGIDYALLPPEVNSGWMYAGPGSGSLMAAAQAWSGLAAELGTATANYQEVISELAGEAWHGPAAASMAAAAAPFVHWMGTTAAQAEQAAAQARAAAAAYETAFAAMVPPPVIASNRRMLASLMATNTLGQNTAAIAANQAEYGEMWAQDAAAMYSYASASAAAATLTPFSPPPQNSNPAGESNQAATVNQAAATAGSSGASALQSGSAPATQGVVPGPIQSLIDSWLAFTGTPLISSANQLAGSFGLSMVNFGAGPFNSSAFQMLTLSGMLGAAGVNGTAWGEAAAAAALPAGALSSEVSGAGLGATLAGSTGPVSAGVGQAPSIRGLSVPQSWPATPASLAANSPAALYNAAALPSADPAGLPAAAMRAGGLSGDRPLIAGVLNTPKKGGSKSRFPARARAAAPAAGKTGAYPGTADRWVQPTTRTAGIASSLSSHERRELEGLRSAVAELTKERDEAARLIRKEFRA